MLSRAGRPSWPQASSRRPSWRGSFSRPLSSLRPFSPASCVRLRGGLGRRAFGRLAETPALGPQRRRGEQFRTFGLGQRGRLAVLGNARVLLAVGDVGTVLAAQDLDRAVAETCDHAVAQRLGFLVQHFLRARQFDRIRIVGRLDRGVGLAVLDERSEAADADADRLAVIRDAEIARQLEQLQRVLERDRVDALARTQRSEARLFGVVLGADLRHRPVAAQAHAERAARGGIQSKFARAAGFGAVDGFGFIRDQCLERRPEFAQQRYPVLFAARYRVEFVLELRGEVVVHVLGEMPGQELRHGAADIGRVEAARVEQHVFAVEQRLDDAGVGRRAADAVFLQRLDQRGLGKARRRLGEMLVGQHLRERHWLRRLSSPAACGFRLLPRRPLRRGLPRTRQGIPGRPR